MPTLANMYSVSSLNMSSWTGFSRKTYQWSVTAKSAATCAATGVRHTRAAHQQQH